MTDPKPPILAQKLLLSFLKDELAEEVLGDLDEKFYSMLSTDSAGKARRNYWYQVFNYLRPFAFKYFKSPSIYNPMIKHNFVIGYRVLLRNKLFSVINIGGLAIGMIVVMLIGFWINDELTFNQNHDNYDRIAQVMRKGVRGGEIRVNESLVSQVGVYLEDNYANLFENVTVTFFRNDDRLITVDDQTFNQPGYFFLPDAPEMFSIRMKAGTRDGLQRPDGIMISESLSRKLFKGENPIGRGVIFNSATQLTVTGVFEDLPVNSTFGNATFLASMELWYNDENPFTWTNFNTKVFVQLKPGVDIADASLAIKDVFNNNRPEGWAPVDLLLLPMKDWHLKNEYENGVQVANKRSNFIQLYGIIGAFVLLLACINFINLNTARFQKRAREVGVRKTLGSLRSPLVAQFLSESILYAFASFAVSILVVQLVLPWFNGISDKEILFPWTSTQFWLLSVTFTFFTAVFAGGYPAVFLSGFKPIDALNGRFGQGTLSTRFRQGLVVFQFTISIVLIIGTITVFEQIQHAKDRPMGFERDRIITVKGFSDDYYRKYDLLRNELKGTGVVDEMAEANYPLTNTLGNNDDFRLPGSDVTFEFSFNTIYVTPEYGDVTQWELIAGRNFSRERGDERNLIIISESAVEKMGLENPIGQQLEAPRSFNGHSMFTIIGVVRDMIKGSPFDTPVPLMVFSNTRSKEFMFIRIKSDVAFSEAVPAIKAAFKRVLPEHPFSYEFLDEQHLAKFRAEERIGSLASLFSMLAIIISCLGLFGLSAFMAERRTKEIGIRKVMGASVFNLWQLLSRDFGYLVILSCLISIPVAYYLLETWLQSYEYRTPVYWWIYMAAGTVCLLVTLCTVSYHTLKVSAANPVNSLRAE